MRNSAAGDDGFVVTKHNRSAHGNAEAVQSEAKIDDLISRGSSCHKFGTVSRGFDGVLLLAAKINDGLICSMCNACDGTACDKVVAKIGVHPPGGDDRITKWCWCIVRNLFLDVAA